VNQPVLTTRPAAHVPLPPSRTVTLSRRQKAAIIVRLLLAEGARLRLDELPEAMQSDLIHEMAALRMVDRATLRTVISEFMDELRDLGAAFPGGVEGALDVLEGALSESNLRRLRKETGVIVRGDPWEMIAALDLPDLVTIIERESTEVAAVVLSKLPVAKSAKVLGALEGDLAHRVTRAVSTTSTVEPATVRTIGHALASQIADAAPRAFADAPVDRIGAILNNSNAATRDGVLDKLTEEDADLGAQVRRAIFTYADIPKRVAQRDVPKITRAVDQALLIVALKASTADMEAASAEYILANMSQRMAAQLREDVEDHDPVRDEDGEVAMAEIVTAIRDMEAAGEIALLPPES